MTEIRGPSPLPTTVPVRPAATELALKLLQPLQGLLLPGEQAQAEVTDIRTDRQDLQVVLRLSLPDGRETTVTTRSPIPVTLGARYAITALSESRVLANLQPADQQPLERLDLALLPIGSQLQARVIGSQALELAHGNGFRLLLGVLGGPLAGTRLLVDSARALPAGSLLTARVGGDQALAFVPLSGRLDQVAVAAQLESQFARQGALPGLLGALGGQAATPSPVGDAARQLLSLLPAMDTLGDPGRLAKAFAASGMFMEAGALADGGASLPTDLKAAMLRLVGQLLPNLPGSSPLAAAQASLGFAQALPAFARQMLGSLGRGSGPQSLDFPLPSRLMAALGEDADLETLLKLAAAAISRLQTHQLASLAQTQTTAEGLQLTTWQVELPMRSEADIVPLQAWLQREEDSPGSDARRREAIWRLELAFDLPPLGPLQVHAQLVSGQLSSQLWAERQETLALLEQELPTLRARLEGAGLAVGSLDCRAGTPPQGRRTRLEQRLVDETA